MHYITSQQLNLILSLLVNSKAQSSLWLQRPTELKNLKLGINLL